MNNKVYLSHHSMESLQSLELSEPKTKTLVETIDRLTEGDVKAGEVVFRDDSPGGGLRSIISDGIQILFRYDPVDRSVFVADISTTTHDRLPVSA